MSFRYKSALLTLVSLVAIYAYYFVRVATVVRESDATGLLLEIIIAIVVAQVVGIGVIAVTSSDRYAPMDERERAIDRRATVIGYYLLVIGALGAAATLHLGATRAHMANAILLAIVVSECIRQAIFLSLHHRDG
jgi:H+/gluconate symporter-like permease